VYADESGPELINQLRAMERDPSWPLLVTVRHTAIVPDETGLFLPCSPPLTPPQPISSE
jgi:hypothetical protein